VAGLIASVACGLGAIPVMFGRSDWLVKHTGLGYGFAGGLMFAASVYNLIWPGLTMLTDHSELGRTLLVVSGFLVGSVFIWLSDKYLHGIEHGSDRWASWGGRTGLLVFIAMSLHSIPEGLAVGVGFASDAILDQGWGMLIAAAISIHNIPEGLAVAIPLRAAGASGPKCFLAAFLTSLPQPIAAVPASYASWLFQPLMPFLMGLAAGAMIFLVILEMIPGALDSHKPVAIAWSFSIGFSAMILAQVLL
jgi:zinc transporter ZupT